MTTQATMTPRAWALMALLGLIWGGSFPATAIALTELSFWSTVAIRVTSAALFLWAFILIRRYPLPRDLRTWAILLSLGLIGNALPFSLITWGQTTVPAGLAAILNASTAIFGVLTAAIFFRDERLTARKLTGVLLGITGLTTAIGIGALRSFDVTSLGQMALVAASVSYGLTGVVGKIALRDVAPQVVATGMLTGAALIMAPLALWIDGWPAPHHSAHVWAAIAYSAIVATSLAYIIYYHMLGMIGAGNAGMTTLIVAPVAIILGAVLLQENLPPRAYAGFLILACGLLILDGRILRLFRKTPDAVQIR
jgi:drug/metabolite transporter (DMT)-like permease